MSLLEDLKNNRDKQIMAISIVFFILAFPIYFGLAAAGADDFAGDNEVKEYQVTGDVTTIQLAAGDEFIPNGDPLIIDDLHTDAIDGADEMNIVGVRLIMSYTEAEEGGNGPQCQGGGNADDTITGSTMHGEYNETASGSNNGDSGSHTVESYWIDESLINSTVNMSKSQIIDEVDAGDLGLGSYMFEISVDASAGGSVLPGCQKTDNGEDVIYELELIIFEYDIVLAPEVEEPEEPEEPEE